MKVRIAAVFATVLLAAAFGTWLWMDREASKGGDLSPDGSGTSQTAASERALPNPAENGTVVRPDSPAASPQVPASAASPARPPGDLPSTPTSRPNPPPAAPLTPAASTAVVTAPLGSPNPEQSEKAAIDVDRVGLMLRDYRTRMGENPFGTNAEIMKAVMGGNPKQARLGPPEGQKLNGEGELLDRWGTPYFFHQLSKSSMEVRSAGPDKVLWTEDDLTRH